METLLQNGFAQLGLALPPEAAEQFQCYYRCLEAGSAVMNLTAITGEAEVARLHFLDCAALLLAADFHGKSVIDVGTGAGFPGLPLKIAEPSIRLTLLDSLQKRVRFLEDTCTALGFTDVTCLHARAEESAAGPMREHFDLAVSRAVARLNVLCELCLPFVRPGGCFLAMKGPGAAEELEEAQNAITLLGGCYAGTFSYTVPGTDVQHCALIIQKDTPTPEKYPRRFARIQKAPL